MEKKELQKLFRDYMKARGFKTKGNLCTKYLSEDYLVFAALEHSSYGPEYGVDYGVVYEADKLEKPFNGMGADWSEYFDWPLPEGGKAPYRFDYENRTAEDFLRCMELNMAQRFLLLEDREYVLNQYREDVSAYRRIPYVTVKKICSLVGTTPADIAARDSRCTSKEMVPQLLKKLGWNEE